MQQAKDKMSKTVFVRFKSKQIGAETIYVYDYR